MTDYNPLPALSADEKDLLESKTLWGAVIGGIAYGLAHFGIAIDQTMWTDTALEFAGVAIVIYGRYRAHKPITSVLGLTLKKFANEEVAALKSKQLKDKATPVNTASDPVDGNAKQVDPNA